MTAATERADAAQGDGAAQGEVVFTFSSLSWGAAARRGWFGSEDRLALSLVEHESVARVLVCDRARSLPLKLVRDRFARPEEAFPQGPDKRLLSPVRARRTDATSMKGVTREFRAYGRAMERGARKMGLEDPVVITTHPLVAGFADLGWARAVTYYALDDWTVHPGYSRWWPAYAEAYERIRERGHRVAAVSAALLERVGPTGEGLVVPNGLEPTEWLGPTESPDAGRKPGAGGALKPARVAGARSAAARRSRQTGTRVRGHLGRTLGRGLAACNRAGLAAGADRAGGAACRGGPLRAVEG